MTYKWVHHEGRTLYDVGILPDVRLHNPRGYPDDKVRVAVPAADARRHERRSNAAKKAAVTRASRQEKKVQKVAERVAAGQGIGAQEWCYICGKSLVDDDSIRRGIGPECWQ